MPIVSISKCDSYEEAAIEEALTKVIENLGGLDKFIKPKQKVLLKINALMGAAPESACPTHPALVKAVAKKVLEIGAEPFIGDAPGNAVVDVNSVYEIIGINKIAKELGIRTVNFFQEGTAEIPARANNKVKVLHISKTVLNADVIINLPKLKTHMMMLYTGAIKNMFGTIPGFHKTQAHFEAPNPQDFAAMLVDIYSATKPQLNIMDAIVGMEGTGPAAGTPREIGLILASADGVALDSIASRIIGYSPFDIPTTKIAATLKIGEANLEKIEVKGENIETLIIKDFKKIKGFFNLTNNMPGFIYTIMSPIIKKLIRIRPKINPEKCIACQTCVRACPMKCIEVKKDTAYNIDYSKCITCFCCHELCPYKAVDLKRSLLAKLAKL